MGIAYATWVKHIVIPLLFVDRKGDWVAAPPLKVKHVPVHSMSLRKATILSARCSARPLAPALAARARGIPRPIVQTPSTWARGSPWLSLYRVRCLATTASPETANSSKQHPLAGVVTEVNEEAKFDQILKAADFVVRR